MVSMLHLDLEEVQAGMIVGQDVRGSAGQLLLSAGVTLTGKHLEVLRMHKVPRIHIQPTTPVTPGAGADLAAIDEQLTTKFRFCNEQQPLIHELRRVCRSRLIRKQEDSE